VKGAYHLTLLCMPWQGSTAAAAGG